MKNFKTIVMENQFAAMPKGLLMGKTSGVLQEHGYDRHEFAENSTNFYGNSSADSNTHVLHHHVDNDHAEHLENEGEGGEGEDYIDDGPHHEAISGKLHELGWKRSSKHDFYHSLGDAKVTRSRAWEHPSGLTMTHVTHHDDGVSHHTWHVKDY